MKNEDGVGGGGADDAKNEIIFEDLERDLLPGSIPTEPSSILVSKSNSRKSSSEKFEMSTEDIPIDESVFIENEVGGRITSAITTTTNTAGDTHSVTMESFTTAASTLSLTEFCKICHCGVEPNMPLITPCFCSGSLKHVHQECLQKWIKSSDIKRCELCKYPFIMQSKVKPFSQWEKLDMSALERRKLLCSVSFHIVAVTCVVWSLYVLIHRTAEEIQEGSLEWPFWTKLVVVAIGFTGGIIFMYIQCKVYVQLCRKWKAYNRIIVVQDAAIDECIKVANNKLSGDGSSGPQSGGSITSHNTPSSPRYRTSADIESQRFNIAEPSPPGGVNQGAPSSSGITEIGGASNNVLEVTTKTNAETQTALRGLSLMEVVRNSESNQEKDVTKILEEKSIFIVDQNNEDSNDSRDDDDIDDDEEEEKEKEEIDKGTDNTHLEIPGTDKISEMDEMTSVEGRILEEESTGQSTPTSQNSLLEGSN